MMTTRPVKSADRSYELGREDDAAFGATLREVARHRPMPEKPE